MTYMSCLGDPCLVMDLVGLLI